MAGLRARFRELKHVLSRLVLYDSSRLSVVEISVTRAQTAREFVRHFSIWINRLAGEFGWLVVSVEASQSTC